MKITRFFTTLLLVQILFSSFFIPAAVAQNLSPQPSGNRIQIEFDPFEPEFLLKRFKNAKTYSTDQLDGNDIGAKINLLDRKCGTSKCIIRVRGGGDFLSPAYPSENRLIWVETGVYKSEVPTYQPSGIPNYGRVIYPKSNTIIYAPSWDSIIDEGDAAPGFPPPHSLIAPANLLVIPEGESTSNITKSENIHVIGLQFRGNLGNPANDIGLSAVGIGNDDNSSVQDCYFNRVSGYGVSVGGTPGEFVVGGTLPDGRTVGFHARNAAVLRNRFEGLLTQNLGLITFDGLLVADNIFINPGRLQPDGSWSPALTVIDIEPNGNPREIVRGLRLIRNRIYGQNAVGTRYWSAIAFQITAEGIFNENNEISDNVVFGAENGRSQLSGGIQISIYTHDLTISRNYIKNAGQSGLSLSGNNVRAIGNILENVGGGGSAGVSAYYLTNSQVRQTSIALFAGGVPGSLDIYEAGVNTNNLWEQNEVGGIWHLPDSTVTDSLYRNNVTRFGINESANSRNNKFINNLLK